MSSAVTTLLFAWERRLTLPSGWVIRSNVWFFPIAVESAISAEAPPDAASTYFWSAWDLRLTSEAVVGTLVELSA